MESKLGIVLPVTQLELARKLLIDLDNNTVKPSIAIILDDSDNGFSPPSVGFPIVLKRMMQRIGVNALWNLGISHIPPDMKYVLVINDDMTVPPVLIEMVLETFNQCKTAGAVHPTMIDIHSKKPIETVYTSGGNPTFHEMTKRCGGAFTFRKEILDSIPPIPKELFAYCGDDWVFDWTYKLGHTWMMIDNCIIYHHGSLGAKQRGLKELLKNEKRIYHSLSVKYGLGVK